MLSMNKILLLIFIFIISYDIYAQTYGNGVTDIDGNVYEIVSIGNQCWAKTN